MIVLLLLMVLMGLFQAVGVASILPFMNLVVDPGIIETNQWLNWFYNWGNFDNTHTFIMVVGFLALGVIIFANAVSALTVWMKLRFVWRNNLSLSQKLLHAYLSRPEKYFHIRRQRHSLSNKINALYNSKMA